MFDLYYITIFRSIIFVALMNVVIKVVIKVVDVVIKSIKNRRIKQNVDTP